MANSELYSLITNLQETAEKLYWMTKYAYLGALQNQDENSAVFGALEQMADSLNQKVMDVQNQLEND